MRDFVGKVGSLVLGVGALSALLVNAALTHGCSAARRDTPAAQAGVPPPVTAEQPRGAGSLAAPDTSAAATAVDDDCEPVRYMPATKSGSIGLLRCRKPTPSANKQAVEPVSPANDMRQQAP